MRGNETCQRMNILSDYVNNTTIISKHSCTNQQIGLFSYN